MSPDRTLWECRPYEGAASSGAHRRFSASGKQPGWLSLALSPQRCKIKFRRDLLAVRRGNGNAQWRWSDILRTEHEPNVAAHQSIAGIDRQPVGWFCAHGNSVARKKTKSKRNLWPVRADSRCFTCARNLWKRNLLSSPSSGTRTRTWRRSPAAACQPSARHEHIGCSVLEEHGRISEASCAARGWRELRDLVVCGLAFAWIPCYLGRRIVRCWTRPMSRLQTVSDSNNGKGRLCWRLAVRARCQSRSSCSQPFPCALKRWEQRTATGRFTVDHLEPTIIRRLPR